MNVYALLQDFIIASLVQLYTVTGSLGWAIIGFTIIIRSLLIPLTIPSMRAQQKMQLLKPELDKLKQKHKNNKQELQKAQMELYQRHNLNPLAGCIPQLVQIGLLIVLYHVLINFLKQTEIQGVSINPSFLWLNLSLPDQKYLLPVLAGVTQFILSLMIAPGGETADIIPNNSKNKKIQEKNKQEDNIADMAASMQQQMIFMMPVMTGFIALNFPSGLSLYWIVTTVFSIAQQWAFSGPGGLVTYTKRAMSFIKQKV
jgi:YidC/Oxa1 family membrane protein insertase